MTKRFSTRRAIGVSLLMLATISCAALEGAPTSQPLVPLTGLTPVLALPGNGGQGGANVPATSTAPTPSFTPSPIPSATPSLTPTPTPRPTVGPAGPYVVKQTESLGHETLAGQVCDVTKPFVVNATAPAVSWTFNFVPADAAKGSWTYAYTISKAGETHAAAGAYTLSPAGADGTLLLSMKGTDNVAFKGFSGPFPVNYQFDLGPSAHTNCLPVP